VYSAQFLIQVLFVPRLFV